MPVPIPSQPVRARPLLTGCRRALDQVCLRLQNRRKGLIEISRHLAEIFAATGLRRQPQRDTGLINLFEGFIDLCVGSRQRFLRPIILLTAFSRGPEQLLCPIEVKFCQSQRRLSLSRAATRACKRAIWLSRSSTARCNFQRRLLASASIPRVPAVAACRSASAVSTAAFL